LLARELDLVRHAGACGGGAGGAPRRRRPARPLPDELRLHAARVDRPLDAPLRRGGNSAVSLIESQEGVERARHWATIASGSSNPRRVGGPSAVRALARAISALRPRTCALTSA